MPFKSLMMEFFENSHTEELIQCMFAHINRQVENPPMSDIGLTLDHIMQLHINFYLALKRGSSHTKLPEQIAKKNGVINTKTYRQC